MLEIKENLCYKKLGYRGGEAQHRAYHSAQDCGGVSRDGHGGDWHHPPSPFPINPSIHK